MIVWWIALACAGGTGEATEQEPSGLRPPATAIADPPEPGCLTPATLPTLSSEWRWALESDFHPNIAKLESDIRLLRGKRKTTPPMTCVFGETDFNGDQANDVVGLTVHRISGASQLVARFAGEAKLHVLADFVPLEAGGIYTSFQIKPSGEGGILARDSPSLKVNRKSDVANQMRASAGVSICRPMKADEAGRPQTLDTDNICSCTEQFYFVKTGGFQSEVVCD